MPSKISTKILSGEPPKKLLRVALKIVSGGPPVILFETSLTVFIQIYLEQFHPEYIRPFLREGLCEFHSVILLLCFPKHTLRYPTT